MIDTEYVQAVKIRLQGIGTPWSGDIPFDSSPKQRDSAVLVRIPTKDKEHRITVWCRWIKDEVAEQQQRYLFIFSPIYMARSLLPNPLTIMVQPQNSSAAAFEFPLEGRDQPAPLETIDSPDTKYLLSFKVSDSLPASEPFLLSWGIIEKLRDKKYRVPPIDEALQEIEAQCQNEWPFVADLQELSSSAVNEQPKTDVQVTFTQFHPICNTVCAEINPWCLLVNQLEVTLLLKDQEDKVLQVSPHSVVVPPNISHGTFHLGLCGADNSQYFGEPLQLTDQEWHFHNLVTMPFEEGRVPLEGLSHSKVNLGDGQVAFLTIRARNEKGLRVLDIVPTFKLVNETEETLSVASFSVAASASRRDLQAMQYLPTEVAGGGAAPLLHWQLLQAGKTLFDGFQYLAVSTKDSDWSDPVCLEDCRSASKDSLKSIVLPFAMRRVHSLLTLTMHQRAGQLFAVLRRDACPFFVLHNQLQCPVFFRASANNATTDTFRAPASSTISAPSPASVQSMAKVENLNAKTKFHLTVVEALPETRLGHDWEVVSSHRQWSEGIDIQGSPRDHYVAVPGYGDAIVHVEKVGRQVFVFVDPFSGKEISAKDVRGRIFESSSLVSLDSCSSDTSELEQTFCTIQSPAATEYHSAIEEQPQLDGHPLARCHLTLYCDQISLVVTDDCIESLSMIDEFIRVTLDRLLLRWRPQLTSSVPLRSLGNRPAESVEASLSLGQIQVDNQMYNRGAYDFPIILQSSILESSSTCMPIFSSSQWFEIYNRESCCSLAIVLGLDPSPCAVSVVLRVQPLQLFIEDVFVQKMAEVARSLAMHGGHATSKSLDSSDPLSEARMASRGLAGTVLLDKLELHSISVLLSLHASVKAFVGLDQTPLQFSAYTRDQVHTTLFALGQSISRHYISGMLFRAGWVVGSLEMIGSPVGLTRAVGDGIRDFVAMPYHGILNGPWAFLRGFTHGSSSLVKHVSAGTLTSVTNFASSVSRNLDRLSLDSEHCQRNELARRSLPQGVGHGLINGLSGIGISVLGAIGGLAHHPIKSLIEQGPSPGGLVGGITRGLVGVVTKPIGGAAEFVAQAGRGILVGTGWTHRPALREPSLPLPICSLPSSAVKYEWKMNCGQIICMTEVTMEKNDGLAAASLVLTPEALTVVDEDEDAQFRSFPILEANLRPSKVDPTRLEVLPLRPKRPGHEDEELTNERIVQFVLDSRIVKSVDDANDNEDENENAVVFYMSATRRQALIDAFEVAKSHLRRAGFPILL